MYVTHCLFLLCAFATLVYCKQFQTKNVEGVVINSNTRETSTNVRPTREVSPKEDLEGAESAYAPYPYFAYPHYPFYGYPGYIKPIVYVGK